MDQSPHSPFPFGTAAVSSGSTNLKHAPTPPKQILKQNAANKPLYQDFIKDFPNPLYYFSQNKNTSSLIDPVDADTVINMTKEHAKFRRISIFSIGLFNMAVTTLLQRRSRIFGLTYRVSLTSSLVKYLFIPLLGTSILDIIYFLPKYSKTQQNIIAKYDFIHPLLVQEYEADPNPYSTINSFVNHRFGSVQ